MTKLNETPTYTLNGYELRLKPIPPFILLNPMRDYRDYPEAPMVEIQTQKGKTRYERNYGDPNYLAQIEHWEQRKNAAMMRIMFLMGIEGTVSDYVSDETVLDELHYITEMTYGNEYDLDDLKYTWISSILHTTEQITDLQEAIQALSIPTEKGIEESSFRVISDNK